MLAAPKSDGSAGEARRRSQVYSDSLQLISHTNYRLNSLVIGLAKSGEGGGWKNCRNWPEDSSGNGSTRPRPPVLETWCVTKSDMIRGKWQEGSQPEGTAHRVSADGVSPRDPLSPPPHVQHFPMTCCRPFLLNAAQTAKQKEGSSWWQSAGTVGGEIQFSDPFK